MYRGFDKKERFKMVCHKCWVIVPRTNHHLSCQQSIEMMCSCESIRPVEKLNIAGAPPFLYSGTSLILEIYLFFYWNSFESYYTLFQLNAEVNMEFDMNPC